MLSFWSWLAVKASQLDLFLLKAFQWNKRSALNAQWGSRGLIGRKHKHRQEITQSLWFCMDLELTILSRSDCSILTASSRFLCASSSWCLASSRDCFSSATSCSLSFNSNVRPCDFCNSEIRKEKWPWRTSFFAVTSSAWTKGQLLGVCFASGSNRGEGKQRTKQNIASHDAGTHHFDTRPSLIRRPLVYPGAPLLVFQLPLFGSSQPGVVPCRRTQWIPENVRFVKNFREQMWSFSSLFFSFSACTLKICTGYLQKSNEKKWWKLSYLSACLASLSSRAWAFICCTSIVSGLRLLMYSSWLPIHSARILLLILNLDV